MVSSRASTHRDVHRDVLLHLYHGYNSHDLYRDLFLPSPYYQPYRSLVDVVPTVDYVAQHADELRTSIHTARLLRSADYHEDPYGYVALAPRAYQYGYNNAPLRYRHGKPQGYDYGHGFGNPNAYSYSYDYGGPVGDSHCSPGVSNTLRLSLHCCSFAEPRCA